jgi:hypothetical protein
MHDQQHGTSVHFNKLIVREFSQGSKEDHPYEHTEDYYNQGLVLGEVPE